MIAFFIKDGFPIFADPYPAHHIDLPHRLLRSVVEDTLMLKIEHGCIFLRRAGDKLEGVALLTRQLENADDSIEFFIRRFRLGDI